MPFRRAPCVVCRYTIEICVCVFSLQCYILYYSILSIKCKSRHTIVKTCYRLRNTHAHLWILHTNELILHHNANNRSGQTNNLLLNICQPIWTLSPAYWISTVNQQSFIKGIALIENFVVFFFFQWNCGFLISIG